ncbi:3',5'-cyclic-nucleotide phosphodiesterase [Sulfuriferula sp. AH1]|uniref:3',5'-cyclic-nucleotide phosphodiesterase n=1 Tax=Sulfuriferula sp. AH1 TaxID=1985873 RepID=UPI000B3B7119|nr:3',5'-cyclic-nucleotide phosphodiesterase [Sulfuriferula sp. AH1]ARU31378.1 3',5'-cyclic-nucleotide phosphodiesterase [Sulfuriferula sp. AH1]
MNITILGCSGGIGGGRHTTSLLVDDDILIDAGSGVTRLSLAQLAAIDHVFITHSHLDHILSLPLLLDSVGAMRNRPVTVYAIDGVLEILRQHIFNWRVWPDFSEIPPERPYLRYIAIDVYQAVQLDGRAITALPASHTVPAVGYQLDSGSGSIVFSGDTGPDPALWDWVNHIGNLKALIIETAFPQEEHGIAELSKHLSPQSLIDELKQFKLDAPVYITHLKPGREDAIMSEIAALHPAVNMPQQLVPGQIFSI